MQELRRAPSAKTSIVVYVATCFFIFSFCSFLRALKSLVATKKKQVDHDDRDSHVSLFLNWVVAPTKPGHEELKI